jgi:hypothetical protein
MYPTIKNSTEKLELNQAITVNYTVDTALASILTVKSNGEALSVLILPALILSSLFFFSNPPYRYKYFFFCNSYPGVGGIKVK